MQTLRVADINSGHCVITIARAIKVTGKDGKVTVDLGQCLVMVEPTEATHQKLRHTIARAGYTPVPEEAATLVSPPSQGAPLLRPLPLSESAWPVRR